MVIPTPSEGDDSNNQAPPAEGEPETYTKEQLTALISREVGRVTKRHSVEMEKVTAQLREYETAGLGEMDKLKRKVDELTILSTKLTTEREGLALDRDRAKAAAAVGLDADLIPLIQGETYEEMQTHAGGLAKKYVPVKSQGQRVINPAAVAPVDEVTTKIEAARLAGNVNEMIRLKNLLFRQRGG